MLNGIINVYKEPGFTSHDAVAKLRGIAHQKKIGHTGTLDPAAEGVLPVCLGNATKCCDLLTDETKEYVAVMRLGVTTDTEDMTGVTLEEKEVNLTEEEVRSVAATFLGEQQQIPPMYSALKVDGKKLYELARAGKEVERKPRTIHIFELEIQKIELPLVTMRIVCSKGTYIRSLCRDIGAQLGCGGAMEHLTRSRVGRFGLQDALTLGQLQKLKDEGRLEEALVPVDALFAKIPGMTVSSIGERFLYNGNLLTREMILPSQPCCSLECDGCFRIYDTAGRFCGIYEWEENGTLAGPIKMFLPERA